VVRRPAIAVLVTAILVAAELAGVARAGDAGEGPDAERARAEEVYRTAGAAAALPLFEKVLAAYRDEGDRLGEAITLDRIGNCYKHLGEFSRALDFLGRALEIDRELGERLEEGKTLSHLGLVYWEMSRYPEAIDRLEKAVSLGRALGHAVLEGSALNNLALVYDELGEYERSLELYRHVLEVYDGTGFERGQGDTLGNIGRVHMLLGEYGQALPYFRRALAISERLELKLETSLDLGNLGICQQSLGEIEAALDSLGRAASLAKEAGARLDEAYWLRIEGGVAVERGRYDRGLVLYRQALAAYEGEEPGRDLMEALIEIASLDRLLGDLASAGERLERALAVARRIGSSRGVVDSLLGLGELELARGRPQEAATDLAEASTRAAAMGHRSGEAAALLRQAEVRLAGAELSAARELAERALDIATEIESPHQMAEAHRLLAESLRRTAGEERRAGAAAAAALVQFDRAEAAMGPVVDPDIAWRIDLGRAQTLISIGRREDALARLLAAAREIETVRGRLEQRRFRSGYLQNKKTVYEELVRLLLALGRTGEAFEAAERLRVRTYLESVAPAIEPLPGEDREAVAGKRRRASELRSRVRQLESALEAETAKPPASRRDPAVRLFTTRLVAAEREYQAALDDLLSADRPGRGAETMAGTISAAEISGRLESDEALLEWMVGETESVLFVVRPTRVEAVTLDGDERELRSQVELLRDLILEGHGERWRRPAGSLYARLIAPAERHGWLSGAKRLLLVPHDVLHDLPFSVLTAEAPTAGGRTLVERYELTRLPTAAALTLSGSGRRPPGTLLALAPGRSAPPATREEVRRVASVFDAPRLLVGEPASERRFKQQAGDYRVLHLASHGYFSPLSPLLSGLELEAGAGEDGRLEVYEILGLRLSSELVTLSACSSGLGGGLLDDVPVGGDWVGLARAFLAAGSEAVLAALWRVDDRATMEFMDRFYARWRGSGLDPASALAGLQRELITTGGGRSHPYFWAPFTLLRGSESASGRKIEEPVRITN